MWLFVEPYTLQRKNSDLGVMTIHEAKVSMTCCYTVVNTTYENSGGVVKHLYIVIAGAINVKTLLHT